VTAGGRKIRGVVALFRKEEDWYSSQERRRSPF